MYYYPFGLTMAGISSKAAGGLENKKNKFQNQELDDDLGINYYGFKYRNHDPQIGRFTELDPLCEDYVYNSTYAFSENHVTSHIELEGLEKVHFMDNPLQWLATMGEGWSKGEGGLYETVDWGNRNINPVGIVAHGAYTGATGKDLITDEKKSRIQALGDMVAHGLMLLSGTEVVGATTNLEIKTSASTINLQSKSEVEVVERAMSKKELEATINTGLVRGGREGIHYASNAIGNIANKVRQRLALAQTPEVKASLEVPVGSFSKASNVQPANKMPGGGLERTAVGNIPAKVLKVVTLKK